jgi:hypothetical protein
MPGLPFESKARQLYEPILPDASTVWIVDETAPFTWIIKNGEDRIKQAPTINKNLIDRLRQPLLPNNTNFFRLL